MKCSEELSIAGTTLRDEFRSQRIGSNPVLVGLVNQRRQLEVTLQSGLKVSERFCNLRTDSLIRADLRCVDVIREAFDGRDGAPDQQAKTLRGVDLVVLG